MFDISFAEDGKVTPIGRLDHSKSLIAQEFFDRLKSSCLVDFSDLDYISSAGLGVLLKTQKRLEAVDACLKIVNPSPHIRDIFRYAGLIDIFRVD